MDWQTNPNEEDPCHRHRQGWQFSYWGGSSEPPESTNGIPPNDKTESSYPLSKVKTGKKVWLVGFLGQGGINRLLAMGLTPGVQLEVISSQPSGSVLVAIQDNRIGLGAGMANQILVRDTPLTKSTTEAMTIDTRTYIRDFPVGTVGSIVGYDKVLRGYKGKLLSMGLTPGTEFKIIRVAPLGDPIEIEVRGFHLSLRKQEADALVVEPLEVPE